MRLVGDTVARRVGVVKVRSFAWIPQRHGLPPSAVWIAIVEPLLDVFGSELTVDGVPRERLRAHVVEDAVGDAAEAPTSISVSMSALPDDLVLELIFPEQLVEHHLHVVVGMPVAVVVEGARSLEHASKLDAPG